MLRLLLDGHISPQLAESLSRRWLTVYSMKEWQNGEFLGQEDSAPLEHAAAERFTLVTYDRRTIPPLLKAWAEQDRKHGGVIFIGEKSIALADVGGQVRALTNLVREAGKWDWINRIWCSSANLKLSGSLSLHSVCADQP
jgi:hypothetical protein